MFDYKLEPRKHLHHETRPWDRFRASILCNYTISIPCCITYCCRKEGGVSVSKLSIGFTSSCSSRWVLRSIHTKIQLEWTAFWLTSDSKMGVNGTLHICWYPTMCLPVRRLESIWSQSNPTLFWCGWTLRVRFCRPTIITHSSKAFNTMAWNGQYARVLFRSYSLFMINSLEEVDRFILSYWNGYFEMSTGIVLHPRTLTLIQVFFFNISFFAFFRNSLPSPPHGVSIHKRVHWYLRHVALWHLVERNFKVKLWLQ